MALQQLCCSVRGLYNYFQTKLLHNGKSLLRKCSQYSFVSLLGQPRRMRYVKKKKKSSPVCRLDGYGKRRARSLKYTRRPENPSGKISGKNKRKKKAANAYNTHCNYDKIVNGQIIIIDRWPRPLAIRANRVTN